eukprot:scaffold11493_cov221-Amphora_coffeaeformis.AAC.1
MVFPDHVQSVHVWTAKITGDDNAQTVHVGMALVTLKSDDEVTDTRWFVGQTQPSLTKARLSIAALVIIELQLVEYAQQQILLEK